MQVDFYHLTAMPLDRALPQIAEKVVASGARLLIVSDRDDQRAALDRLLWSYTPDSFLPHALLGAGDDAAQPVLIAADVNAANGARFIALVDGTWRDEPSTSTAPSTSSTRMRSAPHVPPGRGWASATGGAALLEAERRRTLGAGRLTLAAGAAVASARPAD